MRTQAMATFGTALGPFVFGAVADFTGSIQIAVTHRRLGDRSDPANVKSKRKT